MTYLLDSSIRVSDDTRERLASMKHGRMTYDEVINSLIDVNLVLHGKIMQKGRYSGETKGMIMFRHMLKKLIDDWLPTSRDNQDYIRRFYYIIGEQAPAWLGDLEPDQWFTRWLEDTYQDARTLAQEQGGEI